jgi:hypothetical protein
MNSPWRLVDYRNLTNEIDLSEYAFEDGAAGAGDDVRKEAMTG